jgi:hypothetical protein
MFSCEIPADKNHDFRLECGFGGEDWTGRLTVAARGAGILSACDTVLMSGVDAAILSSEIETGIGGWSFTSAVALTASDSGS